MRQDYLEARQVEDSRDISLRPHIQASIERGTWMSDRVIATIAAATIVSVPVAILMWRAWSAIGAFFDGLRVVAGMLGFGVGVAAIALLGLCVWYVKERFWVDIKRRHIEAGTFTVHPESGNYNAYFDASTKTFVQAQAGTMVEQVPAHYSPHIHIESNYRDSSQKEIAGPAALANVPAAKPKVEDLVKLVERNSFQIPLGNSLRGNGPVIVGIDDVHIRVIGSSRKGKSCLAAAIIDLVTQTHDPDVMTIALLDMENKTSKLFENIDHLAVVNIGRKEVELHARNPKQVAEYLHYIRNEMDRRYSLPEAEQAKQPHILVYIEEFLSLKKHRDLDPKVRATLLDDLNELAVRALKVFIHLMACAQVDYADDDLKPLNNNFGMNVSFAVRPEAARSAGFVCSELLSANWANKLPGQCVVEATGCTDLVDAPDYDVKALLKARNELPEVTVTEVSETLSKHCRNEPRNMPEAALQAKLYQVMENPGENMRDCIKRVWGATPGDNEGWKLAKGEYEDVLKTIHQLARKGMEEKERI